MPELGPVQLIAFGFGPDADFQGRVIEELSALEQAGTLRVLDLLFVLRDASSDELVALDYQGEELGAIVGALLGFEFEGDGDRSPQVDADTGHAFGLSEDDIRALAARLEPGYAAGFLLVEHVWARKLKRALRDAGGVPLGEGFLTPETVAAVAVELVAMAEASEELEREQAHAGARS